MFFLPQKREKLFGEGKPLPLNSSAKVRIMAYARGLKRPTEKGKAYGVLSAKTLDVLEALLWKFHNAISGLCFPSYERIAEAAGCARSTVGEAIKALEAAGVLTWVNRITRIRVFCEDLLGRMAPQMKVIRTSNAYRFSLPNTVEKPKEAPKKPVFASKSEKPSGTKIQELFLEKIELKKPGEDELKNLQESLGRCMASLSS